MQYRLLVKTKDIARKWCIERIFACVNLININIIHSIECVCVHRTRKLYMKQTVKQQKNHAPTLKDGKKAISSTKASKKTRINRNRQTWATDIINSLHLCLCVCV